MPLEMGLFKMTENVSSSKALLVMKVCLIASFVIGCFLMTMATIAHRGFLEISASVIPLVAIQWFFYLKAQTKEHHRVRESQRTHGE